MLEEDARIHAGQHSNVTPRADSEITQLEVAGKFFVGF
jgi:hypothetical protein